MNLVGMYAIRHKYSKRWVYETDFLTDPPTQRTDFFKARIFSSREEAEWEFRRRMCKPSHFEVVKVKLIEAAEVEYKPPKAHG